MTHDDDFVFTQVLAQVLRKLNAILHHSFHRDSRRHCGSSFSQGSARASLIPLHHGKMLRPWCEHRECPGVGDVARAAMQEQQHGVVTIPAANCDPLFDTADCDELRLVDALRRRNSVRLRGTGSQKGSQVIKQAIFRVNGWGCGRRLVALGNLPKRPTRQTEERKVTSKNASDHTWLLRDDRDFLIPHNMLRNEREEDIESDLSAGWRTLFALKKGAGFESTNWQTTSFQ